MIKLELVCDLDSAAGYAAHARSIVRALHQSDLEKHGIDLKIVARRKDASVVELSKEEVDIYNHYISKEFGKPDVRVFFEPAQWAHFEGGVKTVIFCQWETTKIRNYNYAGKTTNNWVAQFNLADLVMTSAKSAEKAYQLSGVKTPITTISGPVFPLGTQEELPVQNLVKAGRTGSPIAREERPLVIGYMAQWCPRKNVEAFIRDVTIGFNRGEVIGLVKTYKDAGFKDDENLIETGRIVRDSCRKKDSPDIIFLTEKMSEVDIEKFFNVIDIYYCPSRGEGYNVPAAMAARMGIPVVATVFGGHADFLPENYLIEGSFSPALGMGAYDSNQFWFNIDEMQAISALRELVKMKLESPKDFDMLREEYRAKVTASAGPEQFVQKFVKAIKDLYGESKVVGG